MQVRGSGQLGGTLSAATVLLKFEKFEIYFHINVSNEVINQTLWFFLFPDCQMIVIRRDHISQFGKQKYFAAVKRPHRTTSACVSETVARINQLPQLLPNYTGAFEYQKTSGKTGYQHHYLVL